jgi:hypothetical protein
VLAILLLSACGDNTYPAAAPSDAKQVTAFSFSVANNPSLASDIDAVISGTQIAATLPYGTDMSGLIATYNSTGHTITVGDTAQTSGISRNNFASPVMYVVTAEDGSAHTYTASMTMAADTAKSISSFAFLAAHNSGLASDVTARINGTQISATVPFGTDVSALEPSFTTTGQDVMVGGTEQVSGVTANDFGAVVDYQVTAADSSAQTYMMTVTVALNPAKDVTAFEFTSAINAGLGADVVATFNGTEIDATVPYGTDVTALVATFSTTGTSVAVAGSPQDSGTTANDFSSDVHYVVTAADSSTQTYDVVVSIALNPAKDITAFSVTSALNMDQGVTSDASGAITATTVTVHVPYNADVTSIIPTFSITGAEVTVAGVEQHSGVTANDFTTPITYTVVAADGTTKDYAVTVTPAPLMDTMASTYTSTTDQRCSGAISMKLGAATATTVLLFKTVITPTTDTNVKLVIWNDTTLSIAYASAPIAVTAAAGMQTLSSDSVSVQLDAGSTYQFAAMVEACAYFPWTTGSVTTNGLTAYSRNGNPSNYASPTFHESFAGVNPAFQIYGHQ